MSSSSASDLLTHYVRAFAALHRNRHSNLGAAPHKPILLLAILDLIERGHLRANAVALTPELVASFRALWRVFVPEGTWSDKIIYPYRYLVHEKFWTLYKQGRAVSVGDLGHPTSIGQFAAVADEGRFSDDLWTLLQDGTARAVLRKTLLDTYFAQDAAEQVAEAADNDPLETEAKRLMDEARQVRFRKQPAPKLARETDAAYLRHSLFARVVTRLYDHQCAVCKLGIRDDGGRTLVDAAHILPHAKYGNDDPRNGLALCPNHHRGFDLGWWSVGEDDSLLISPKMTAVGSDYIGQAVRLTLPSLMALRPDRDAFAWHRDRVWQH